MHTTSPRLAALSMTLGLLAALAPYPIGSGSARARPGDELALELEGGEVDPEAEAARQHYADAVKLAKKGQHAEAIAAFEKALPVLGRGTASDIFYNLVSTARARRDWRRVLLYAQGFAMREQGTKDAAEVDKWKEFALSRLALRVPAGQLAIEAPDGAALYVDDTPVAGPRVTLAHGSYTVTAELKDHLPASTRVVVADGVARVALAPKPANYTGLVTIATTPGDGVVVFVDDVRVGVTPLKEPLELPVGKRLFRFEKAGFDSWTRYVELARGSKERLEPRLEPQTNKVR